MRCSQSRARPVDMSTISPAGQTASTNQSRRAFLNRDSGRVMLLVGPADMQAAHAVSLCKYLVGRGVPCGVAESPSGACIVQLRGVPDLDSVDQFIAEWEANAKANPPEPPSIW